MFPDTSYKEIQREKEKARQLRKTGWWEKKLATGTCFYCNKKFSPDELTMDHVVPLSRGGKSTKNNLVTSCKECNNKKKNSLVFEWEGYIK